MEGKRTKLGEILHSFYSSNSEGLNSGQKKFIENYVSIMSDKENNRYTRFTHRTRKAFANARENLELLDDNARNVLGGINGLITSYVESREIKKKDRVLNRL